jgi:predicted O-linked N-acetylglucosamine transferase (SPINDLY family)
VVHRSDRKHQDKLKRQRKVADKSRRQSTQDRGAHRLSHVLELVNGGRPELALQAARDLTTQSPTAWQAWNLLATVQSHLRDYEAAEQSYQAVTRLAPERPEGWHGLGKVLCSQQQPAKAVGTLQRAAELAGPDAAILCDLARTFLVAGNIESAYQTITAAQSLTPASPDVWNISGLILQQRGQVEEAAVAFCRAAESRPNFVDALANLGECLRILGDLSQAQAILDRALELDPQHGNAQGFSGLLAAMLGQRKVAIERLSGALERNPRYRLFRLQLARCLAADGQVDASMQHLEILEARFGQQADLLCEKAGIHAILGQHDQSRELLSRLLTVDPQSVLARVRRALLVPPIAGDLAEISQCRARLTADVEQLLAEDSIALESSLDDFANAHFYLTYHGQNNVQINQRLSTLYRKLVPGANYLNPKLADLTRLQHPGSKIRVAFVSKNFCNHTIGRLNIGLVQGLDRRRFEVTTCVFPGSADSFQARFAQSSDHFLVLPGDPPAATLALAEHQPDLIFYTDLGMDPTTYQMAHGRIAPIQFTAWGHPITTGISTIDYFLSAQGLDDLDSQAHYSERLVILRNLLLHYERPGLISEAVDKSLLGLSANIRLYLCPQTLFKLHPDFDQVLGEILRRDPNGLLLMIKLGHETWRQKLLARFAQTMPDVQQRILWMDRMSAMKFQHLFRLGDVALDPYRFGSGNTCLEALAMGMPLVTCPDAFMRTRMAAACYQRMGLTIPVTDCPAQFAQRAVEIATDSELRQHLSREISQRAAILFDNVSAVRELEGWMESAVNRHSLIDVKP